MKKLQKGLKKGEKFEDGGRIFIVDEANPDGSYLAHQVTEEPEVGEDDVKKSLQRLKVPELKDMAQKLGIDDDGKKEELIDRIVETMEKASAEEDGQDDENEDENSNPNDGEDDKTSIDGGASNTDDDKNVKDDENVNDDDN